MAKAYIVKKGNRTVSVYLSETTAKENAKYLKGTVIDVPYNQQFRIIDIKKDLEKLLGNLPDEGP